MENVYARTLSIKDDVAEFLFNDLASFFKKYRCECGTSRIPKVIKKLAVFLPIDIWVYNYLLFLPVIFNTVYTVPLDRKLSRNTITLVYHHVVPLGHYVGAGTHRTHKNT